MKILIVIANFGTNQVDCIKKSIEEYKSWPEEIDIIINSNIDDKVYKSMSITLLLYLRYK